MLASKAFISVDRVNDVKDTHAATSAFPNRRIEPHRRLVASKRNTRRARSLHAHAMKPDEMKRVYVYSGEGAGHRSVVSAVQALEESLGACEVHLLSTRDLLETQWQTGCHLLCMPGGADLPYCKDLNGKGNQRIRGFVEAGGSYLGLCAGAYYACSRIEFEVRSRLEVKGDRELKFFPGLARGSVYPGFAYQTEAGTHAAPLRFKGAGPDRDWEQCRDYCNGGPAFLADASPAFQACATPLAMYEGDLGVAAVRCQVGKGVAVLCGTHPELGPRWLDAACSAKAVQEAHPQLIEREVAQLVETAKHVRQALVEDDRGRRKFWHLLLSEANLRSEP